MTVSDLSPDALARLEAKLVADLEMVRKVRALLEEHRAALGGVVASPVVSPVPTVVGSEVSPSEPAKPAALVTPHKSFDEACTDSLLALPERGFAIKDFKLMLRKRENLTPQDSSVKTFINRMIRKGQVVVVESRPGRNGSLYRCTLPRPKPVEDLAPNAVSSAEASIPPVGNAD